MTTPTSFTVTFTDPHAFFHVDITCDPDQEDPEVLARQFFLNEYDLDLAHAEVLVIKTP